MPTLGLHPDNQTIRQTDRQTDYNTWIAENSCLTRFQPIAGCWHGSEDDTFAQVLEDSEYGDRIRTGEAGATTFTVLGA